QGLRLGLDQAGRAEEIQRRGTFGGSRGALRPQVQRNGGGGPRGGKDPARGIRQQSGPGQQQPAAQQQGDRHRRTETGPAFHRLLLGQAAPQRGQVAALAFQGPPQRPAAPQRQYQQGGHGAGTEHSTKAGLATQGLQRPGHQQRGQGQARGPEQQQRRQRGQGRARVYRSATGTTPPRQAHSQQRLGQQPGQHRHHATGRGHAGQQQAAGQQGGNQGRARGDAGRLSHRYGPRRRAPVAAAGRNPGPAARCAPPRHPHAPGGASD